jgi:hypothetical protein
MRTRIGFLAVLVTLGVGVALYAGGRQQQRGANPEHQAKLPPQPADTDTFHDIPETVDNQPIRIYRFGSRGGAIPTMAPGFSGKRWLLTNSEQSLPVAGVWIWAGRGTYGSLPFVGQIPAHPGDRIQLDFTNAGTDHHLVTITQDLLAPGSTRAPLWLENDDFAFEQQSGVPHHLKLDSINDPKYSLNSVRVGSAMLCVRTGSGGTAAYPCGFTNYRSWKVQIKICPTLCGQAPQQ